MNTQQQKQLEAALDATLADGQLSNAEEKALRQVIADLPHDKQSLAFARNLAFRKAREHIEESPAHILRWLERFDKIIDNTPRKLDDASKQDTLAIAFSPGEDGRELIQREIRACRETLDICVFTITDDRVTRTITDAHERGVKVRVITDNDKQYDSGSDIQRMARAGVPARFDPYDDHMHHKFAIADNKRLITGSYNWTRGATRNHENVTVLSNPDLINAFSKEFNKLWQTFKP